ncbi:MAG: DUF262 domain-containing protein [Vicinamibacterales bacterium]
METQVRTPQLVFMQPQRLIVPLFQRPYVWNEENQWEPLWGDVTRVAERLLDRPQDRQQPHFLGAVVLQQVQNPIGRMQERTIIDGQQRLTTLQILLDALHAELMRVEAIPSAMRLEPLVANSEHFCTKPEDRFKVWPTNRDRAAFNAVMGAAPPVDYEAVGFAGQKMVEAHRYFSEQARAWLSDGSVYATSARAAAVETVVRELLQMVVIDLGVDENAQEIFETLNARGAQLTAADLIKNFVFQRLLEAGADVQGVYESKWKEFETAFWEAEIGVGRRRYPRSSVFLNHWLVARTGKDVVDREVFDRFKRFATYEAGVPMLELLGQIDAAARVYRDFVTKASSYTGPIDRLGLFGYRTGVLESEVIKPVVLCLLDPRESRIPEAQLEKALEVVESWMVRRMLVRATTKSYNLTVAELVALLSKSDRASAGDVVQRFFAEQTSPSSYWPDDSEVREELRELLAYRRLRRGRLRMVLEAIEDSKRGWGGGRPALGEERVTRGRYAIEHVMPRKWTAHWPLPEGHDDAERDRLVHTLGNLTLLTGRLNSKVSNGPWVGENGKRAGLEAHDVLFLNRELVKGAHDWSEASIHRRTAELADTICRIWPVPENHRSGYSREKATPRRSKVGLADLIGVGLLQGGMALYRRRKKSPEQAAILLPDGRIEANGVQYSSPSEAASAIRGVSTNGWWFFLVQQTPRRSLKDVWREYVDSLSVDLVDDDGDDDGDDEE